MRRSVGHPRGFLACVGALVALLSLRSLSPTRPSRSHPSARSGCDQRCADNGEIAAITAADRLSTGHSASEAEVTHLG
jgi:hypothetical protein